MSRLTTLSGAALLAAAPAFAHHSPAAYDMQKTVAIEGTVTAFEWANPHAYLSVQDAAGGRTWLVELVSPSALKQFGWSPTTLGTGDRVSLTVYPGRNATRNSAFLVAAEKGGVVLYDTRAALGATGLKEVGGPAGAPPAAGPPGAASPGAGPGNAPPGSGPPGTARPASAKTVAGTWATLPGPALGQLLGNAAALPVTPIGAAAIRDFTDAASNPGQNCVPFSPPIYMILPVFRSIEIAADTVTIRGEEGDVDRTVHLNRTSHDGAMPSVLGDSIGRFEGAVLVVDTAQFAEHPIGNAAGLPSSPRKHLVERFELRPDGGGLTYTFVLEDPAYLTEPVRGMSPWAYRPDVRYAAIECNLENARKFLGE